MNSDFDRMRIRRAAANPMAVPTTPKFPEPIKQHLAKIRQSLDSYDGSWEQWRQGVQFILDQAIMSLKLDPTEMLKLKVEMTTYVDKLGTELKEKIADLEASAVAGMSARGRIVDTPDTVQGPQGDVGPAGPQGETGPAGRGEPSYVHTQAFPSSLWSIIHNMGRLPVISVTDTNGFEIYGMVVNQETNSAIAFTSPVAGKAVCV